MRLTYILIAAALAVLLLIGTKGTAESEKTAQPTQAALPSRPWQDADSKTHLNVSAPQLQEPRSRSLKLNVEMLQTVLRRAPQESLTSNKNESVTLDLPVPDAGFMRFNIEDSPNHGKITGGSLPGNKDLSRPRR